MKIRYSIAVLVAWVALLSACASTQPMWKASDIANLSESHVRLGNDEGAASVETALVRKLIEIKERIESAVGAGNAELVIAVSEPPNAFAGQHPKLGRIVGINTGMINLVASDWDGYAAIIGHEYAHLALNHGVRRNEREVMRQGAATVIGMVLGVVGVPMGGTIADIGTAVAARVYTREDEREADRRGLEYMVRAGFDPNGAVRTWERMHAAGHGSSLIPFLSTHPLSTERIRNLQALILARQSTHAAASSAQLPEPKSAAVALGADQSARERREPSAAIDSRARIAAVGALSNDPPRTPDMLTAVMISDAGTVSYYLAQGLDINGTVNGSTYLIAAVQSGDLDMVRFLIGKGADVNRGDRRGFTPLVHARTARPPDPRLIQALIDAGARAEQ